MESTSDTPSSSPEPRKATGEHPVTAGELKHVVKIHDARVILSVVATIIGTTVTAWMLVRSEARAEAKVVTHEVTRRLDALESAHKEHLEDSRRVHALTRDDVHEVQTDIRDLYKTITTGRPSPRLERPIDGGK
jgi:hypothetical protein